MKFEERGMSTSGVELTNVSAHGFWILVGGEELFLSFEQFPWFKDATIGQITGVELVSEHHLYWPALDVDLSLDSVRHPEKYPLVSNIDR